MLPQELIRAKRDGRVLTDGEITGFISGLTDGRVTEGQARSEEHTSELQSQR